MEILKNNKKSEDIPIEYLKGFNLTLNNEIVKKLGIKIPDKLKGEFK